MIRKKQIREVELILREVSRAATFETAYFGDMADIIKDKTKLFRETWIIDRLNAALLIVDNELKR